MHVVIIAGESGRAARSGRGRQVGPDGSRITDQTFRTLLLPLPPLPFSLAFHF